MADAAGGVSTHCSRPAAGRRRRCRGWPPVSAPRSRVTACRWRGASAECSPGWRGCARRCCAIARACSASPGLFVSRSGRPSGRSSWSAGSGRAGRLCLARTCRFGWSRRRTPTPTSRVRRWSCPPTCRSRKCRCPARSSCSCCTCSRISIPLSARISRRRPPIPRSAWCRRIPGCSGWCGRHRRGIPSWRMPGAAAGCSTCSPSADHSRSCSSAPGGASTVIDLDYLREYPVRAGLQRLGCRVRYADADTAVKLTGVEFDGRLVTPADTRWPLAERVALCSLATHTTVWRHGMQYHVGGVAPFATATHALPPSASADAAAGTAHRRHACPPTTTPI